MFCCNNSVPQDVEYIKGGIILIVNDYSDFMISPLDDIEFTYIYQVDPFNPDEQIEDIYEFELSKLTLGQKSYTSISSSDSSLHGEIYKDPLIKVILEELTFKISFN